MPIKLLRSLADGAVFDMPPQGVSRYIEKQTGSKIRIWRFDNRLATIPSGKTLRIELADPAAIHWSADGWTTVKDIKTKPSGLGTHFADLPLKGVEPGHAVVFTFFWPESGQWENVDFAVRVGE